MWLFLSGALLLVASTVAALLQPPHPDAWRVEPGWLSLDFWRWPIERNAFMRLPRISAGINALHVADDGRIWLATGAGEILHGSADGMRWVRQWPPDEASAGTAPKTARSALPGIADAAAQGLPAGNGKQYAPARPLPPPARPALRALHFLPDGRHGWAVGESGTILAGTDGGDTWTRRASGTDKYLIAVHFTADGRRGWAVGDSGTILASTDGGDTWTPRASGITKALIAVHFTADGRRGWAVGENGTILASTDGGDT
ncbi:MAG: hypothetical protein JSR94_00335, partial [Proteobacteria bacterium]|nr:hypothetical protein [Pseudomonadota bacterium]